MPGRYRVLAAGIRAELPAIERAISHAAEAVERSEDDAEDADFFLEAAAFSVHSAYTAVERVLEEIARVVDETQPSGADWHRDLVRQMGLAPAGLRPAVLQDDVARELQEILRFRHLVRNILCLGAGAGARGQQCAALRTGLGATPGCAPRVRQLA